MQNAGGFCRIKANPACSIKTWASRRLHKKVGSICKADWMAPRDLGISNCVYPYADSTQHRVWVEEICASCCLPKQRHGCCPEEFSRPRPCQMAALEEQDAANKSFMRSQTYSTR